MLNFYQNRMRIILIPGAIICMVLAVLSIPYGAEDIFLSPPGLRPLKDPALVIPADYRYPNASIRLPAYRDAGGNPTDGWSGKYVSTRRFVSNQSAWIYYRNSDLHQSAVNGNSTDKDVFRFWPVGAIIVIESYKGNAFQATKDQLVEIDVMVKVTGGKEASRQAFHPVNWTYARFKPDGSFSATPARIRECHQCHSIAFHLTGDLIFTNFP
jgi:hypothetical protein